jgi:CubicO group peptidase (beta-lactamase class C family)
MGPGALRLQRTAEDSLWPIVEHLVRSHGLAGLAVAVVRDGEVALSRGFGVKEVGALEPVTTETMFHLASVSKPFVATAIVGLATRRVGAGEPTLDLDAPVVEWLPEFSLADGRAREVTLRHLLTHTSGIPDVIDFGWHVPDLGDYALKRFVLRLSGFSLTNTPGSTYSYCNAGFELLGHLLSRVSGQTFETAIKQLVLDPVNMHASTFLRADVSPGRAAAPHVGVPLTVPEGVYPYTRSHAPSSTLHSSTNDLCRWMLANLAATGPATRPAVGPCHLRAELLDVMWQPAVPAGRPPWEEAAGMGWFLGTYQGRRTVSHSGADPGFGSKLILVPEERTGVVVLANSNTAPTDAVARAALDLAFGVRLDYGPPTVGVDPAHLSALLPPVVGPIAAALAESGTEAAVAAYGRLASAEPATVDLDDERFVDGVWGAIELHRTDLVWPLLRLWTTVRPESPQAWTMMGWAHKVDGRPEPAMKYLRRALNLDAGNHDAAVILRSIPSAT